RSHRSSRRRVDLRVDFDDGETVWIRDISREATAERLKQRLQQSGVPVQGLTLTFLGLSLKDHWRLADCGIKDCDAVKADMQVKRGGHFVGAQLAAAVQAVTGRAPCRSREVLKREKKRHPSWQRHQRA
ncbi:unnamed protein product, partial [Symbiodinium microadriaticum]